MTEAGRYAEQEKGLERKLNAWQLAMIAMGRAIGVGLFLGSGATIGLAGLGVERLDFYLEHEVDAETPLEETLRAFDNVIRQGKAHYIYASN